METTEGAAVGRIYDGWDKAAAWGSVAAGYCFIRFFGGGRPLGAALLVVLMFALTLVWGCCIGRRFTRGKDLILPLVAAVFSVGLLFSAVPMVRFALSFFALLTYAYWVSCWVGETLEGMPGDLLFFELLKTLFVVPFPAFGRIFGALFQKRRGKGPGTAVWILIGIAVAILPAVLIAKLLTYDAAFTALLEKIGLWLNAEAILSRLGSLILSVPAGMYLFALLSGSRNRERQQVLTPERHRAMRESLGFAPVPLAAAALTPALVVYVLYFISQIDSYLLTLVGEKPAEAYYAAYAREGFFELCAVAAINAVLLGAAALFIRRKANGHSPVLRIYSAVYALFTLILIATALSKMLLYVRALGFTRSRLLTCVFMVWMGIVFLGVLIKTLFVRANVWGTAVVAGALLLAALGLTDMDRLVVSYNGAAYLAGQLEELDVELFYSLGDGAVAPAVALYNDSRVPAPEKAALRSFLKTAAESYTQEDPDGRFWRFTLPRSRALEALREAGFLTE